MSEYTNVTVVKNAKIYFDGKVTSRTLIFPDGSKKTLGVMLPGEYEFNTAEKELMEIYSGEVDVLLPEAEDWVKITGGQSFEVPPQAKFQLKVEVLIDYCCSFLD